MDWKQLTQWDENVSAYMRRWEQRTLLRKLAIFFTHSADPWISLLLLGLLWYWGLGLWKQMAFVMIVGTLFTAVVVFVFKYSVRRSRPAGEWGKMYRITNPHSFPSGHTARCVMLSVIGIAWGPLWFGALLFIYAVFVGFSRVMMGVHYFSDVFAGAVIGFIIGELMLWIPFRTYVGPFGIGGF